MRPYILNEANWRQVKGSKYEIAILPWGATEPHNYHLPYGTDNLQAGRIAAEASSIAWKAGVKVMVLPTIPLGMQNPGQVDLTFCLNTKFSTQQHILKDILDSLKRQEIQKLVILNSHGGNDFRTLIRDVKSDYEDMFIASIDWFKMLDFSRFFDEPGDHAGEMETSVMQYYYPELVDSLDKAGDGRAKTFRITAMKMGMVNTPRDWSKVTNDTGVGNPKMASPEKGQKMLEVLVPVISDFLVELNSTNVDNIYE